MPPPRLSRHLRPCHHPVTAKQVHYVHTTGRAKLSTTGNDTTPQKPNAKGSNGEGSALSDPTDSKKDVSAEEKPWWKKALSRVASFGRHGEQLESIGPKSGQSPHAEQPERSATNLQGTWEESGQEERGLTELAASPTTSQQDKETQRGQMRFAESRKDDSVFSEQLNVATLQQQIHKLSEQLRAVEARLDTSSPAGQSSSTSAGILRTLTTLPEATQFSMDDQDLAYPNQTTPGIQLSTKLLLAEGRQANLLARAAYARSVNAFGKAAYKFAKMPAHIVAPMAPSILRRFRAVRAMAILDDDTNVIWICRRYNPTIDKLESILRKSSIPIPSLSDPVVAYELSTYSKILLYDNLISHTWDACRKRYHTSCDKLGEVATKLGNLQSPGVAPIASLAREKLQTVGQGDRVVLDLIGPQYETESALRNRIRSAEAKRLASIPRSAHTRKKDVLNDIVEGKDDRQKLKHRVRTRSRSIKLSPDLRTDSRDHGLETPAPEQHPKAKDSMSFDRGSNAESPTAARATESSNPLPRNDEVSEQSLFEELFPESNRMSQPQPPKKDRDQYPRLKLPKSPIRPVYSGGPQIPTRQAAESIQQRGEQIAVLQLTNCSTGLTEADFRRIIPKGKHLEGWRRDSDFEGVIPGRDPLSLERLPFYYLLFKSTEAALSYQKNASRLHKLSARYQPSSILSAIPPPKGFLEDGEDIATAVASYNLLPKNHSMSLNVLMQPYHPALRQLIERGGYQPIATSAEHKGKRMCRVLLHIEGYEPSPSDLFAAITRDAYEHGMLHPLRNESQSSVHRLRDVINLKMSSKAVSSSRPRAYLTSDHANLTSSSELTYDDPEIQSMMGGTEEGRSQAQMNQEIMHRVYNRWVLDFEDADTARRWSLRWHRRVFPDLASGDPTWKDAEETRICNTEVLW